MANIFETARAERAYNKYVKGLESMAGLVDTKPRSKDAHGDEGSWLKNAGAFHRRQVH